MLIDYMLVIAFVAVVALVWRALLLDHPALLAAVERIPLAGGALRCGFCMALWLSLAGVLVYNPLGGYLAALDAPARIVTGWFAVAAGVLVLRNFVAALMEGTGVLTHLHRSAHKD